MTRARSYIVYAFVSALLFTTVACHKTTSDEEAVRAAVLAHLQQRATVNLSAMDTSFQQITIDRDRAQAQVLFKAKQEGATMLMNYALERRDGHWTVLGSQPAGGQIAHPPVDGTHGNGPAGGAASGGSDLPHLQIPPEPAKQSSKPR